MNSRFSRVGRCTGISESAGSRRTSKRASELLLRTVRRASARYLPVSPVVCCNGAVRPPWLSSTSETPEATHAGRKRVFGRHSENPVMLGERRLSPAAGPAVCETRGE